MSKGLGRRQRDVLDALRGLEAAHGSGQWFFVHAVVRAAWPDEGDATTAALRLSSTTEATLNPSRIIAALARRGLIDRNPQRGPGASIRSPNRSHGATLEVKRLALAKLAYPAVS